MTKWIVSLHLRLINYVLWFFVAIGGVAGYSVSSVFNVLPGVIGIVLGVLIAFLLGALCFGPLLILADIQSAFKNVEKKIENDLAAGVENKILAKQRHQGKTLSIDQSIDPPHIDIGSLAKNSQQIKARFSRWIDVASVSTNDKRRLKYIIISCLTIGSLVLIGLFGDYSPSLISGNGEIAKQTVQTPSVSSDEMNRKLFMEARRGNVKVVKELLDMGGDPNTEGVVRYVTLGYVEKATDTKMTALTALAFFDVRTPFHTKTFELLLEKGAQKDLSETLAIAAQRGNVPYVKILVDNKADVNGQGQTGIIPILFTTHSDIIDLLIENGADVNTVGGFRDFTPLTMALGRGDYETAKNLIENGADVNLLTNWGTPLIFSISGLQTVEPVEFLLKSGADITIKNKEGKTAIDYSKEYGLTKITELLVKWQDKNAG